MAEPFYARGPKNCGYIKNMEVIAFDDDRGLPGGGQPQIYRQGERYYLYSTMRNEIGIWDVTDPARVELLRHFAPVDEETYPTTDNPKIQVADDLLIVAQCSGSGPAFMKRPPIDPDKHKAGNGILIYSLKDDPVNPEFLSYWDTGVPFAMGVHRFMYDGGRYVHLSADPLYMFGSKLDKPIHRQQFAYTGHLATDLFLYPDTNAPNSHRHGQSY